MKYSEVRIADIANFINGFAFKPDDWGNIGLPIIRIQNLNDPEKAFNRTVRNVSKKYRVKKGDILVSWSATIAVFEWDNEDALLNQHIFKVEFDSSRVVKQYFKLALKKTIHDLIKFAHGSTMKHVVKKDFEKHKIPLPPLYDQIRIATLLSRVEGLIATRKDNLRLLDEFLKSTFLEMFGDPVRNEKGWQTKSLGNIARVERGRFSPRPRNDPKFFGGDFPFIQTGDISRSNGRLSDYSQTLNELGKKVSKEFKKDTIVIAIVGATIGETAILQIDTYAPDSVIGITTTSEEIDAIYLEFLLRFWKPVLKAKAPEAARANININTLKPLCIIIPSTPLVASFVSIDKKVESLQNLYRLSLTELENLYGTLSQKAFKGELDLSRIPLDKGPEATLSDTTTEPADQCNKLDRHAMSEATEPDRMFRQPFL